MLVLPVEVNNINFEGATMEFINEVRASLRRERQSAIRFRDDYAVRKICVKMALSKRRCIRELMAIYG
ncbi:hypothetical protein [Xenorhabdus innexi]|uniref:Uncharacterized protein n=1 Tax=Xenorhabdus innexi TaxID=290109 RepID=A0A1N6N158_9GAMM|nr:hypothetical protein [Xenorhabdus innexi]PHM31322.1 hypothetical protein Xinn_02868 [Xenorhabdus innexi]SIP74774.1 hypothetical protein XIS1_840043 [Xenorhabdus innexi]